MVGWFVCGFNRLKMLDGLCGCMSVAVARRNSGRHWFSRPGEFSRGSPRTRCSISRLDERFLFFEREVVSPKQEGTRLSKTSQSPLSPFRDLA